MNPTHALEVGPFTKATTSAGNWIGKLWGRYWQWRTRLATVAVLRALDDRTLKDLGLHRSEIGSLIYGARCERPFR